MVLLRFVLPAIAGAVAVFAQCDGTIEIKSQDDADELASCSKVDGDIVIDSDVSGTLSIDGVEEITGDLECLNATDLTSLSAESLTTIGGKFNLKELTILANLGFGSLTEVETIQWEALPALQSLAFTTGVSKVENIRISNTFLTSLDGLELETVGLMDINNNRYLEEVDVQDMMNITRAISFSANSKSLEIRFPSLEFAANMTFRDVSDVKVPSLEYVNGSIGFYGNLFETVTLPNLTETGKALVFEGHDQLVNISAPKLTLIGANLNIEDNPELSEIDGFPELEVIEGALDFSGDFDEVSIPSLEDVRGGFNMQTTSEDFSCKTFDDLREEDIVKGVYTCRSGEKDPGGLGSNEGSDGEEDGASHNLATASPFYLFGLVVWLLVL